jgi:uncharacterized protein (DUF1697 family)
MSHVVFMRGVNVGRNRRFQPTVLARELAHLGAVNLGAAGTFVVRKRLAHSAVRAEFLRRLPFTAELMICSAQELLKLAAGEPFANTALPSDVRRCVSVLARRPRKIPPLPFSFPPTDEWQVRIIGVSGRLAWAWWRRRGRSFVDPNEVIEKQLGVSATTRNWNTIVRLCELLRLAEPAGISPSRRT